MNDRKPWHKVPWFEHRYLSKTRWEWMTGVWLPTIEIIAVVGGVLTAFYSIERQVKFSQDQLHLTLRQQALQSYLANMSVLITEQDLAVQEPYDAGAVAAISLTSSVFDQLAIPGDRVDSRHALCSQNREFCIPEKRAVVRLLVSAGLVQTALDEDALTGAQQLEGIRNRPTVSLNSTNISNTNLSVTELNGADLSYADLIGSDLSHANLNSTNLLNANMMWANLNSAEFKGAILAWADLSDSQLKDADMRQAVLATANLRRANLSGVDLRDADLRNADLRAANLRGAIFQGSDLSGADLRRTNISRAGLSGAIYSDENSACSYVSLASCVTKLPFGFDPELAGMILKMPDDNP